MARRGDRIRCTVLFGDEKDEKVQVSVMFSLNGRIIITKEREDQFFMDSDKQLYPYVCMLHGGSVLAKVSSKNVDNSWLVSREANWVLRVNHDSASKDAVYYLASRNYLGSLSLSLVWKAVP